MIVTEIGVSLEYWLLLNEVKSILPFNKSDLLILVFILIVISVKNNELVANESKGQSTVVLG